MIQKIPFEIKESFELLDYSKKVDIQNSLKNSEIFERNIYFNHYNNFPNLTFKQKSEKYCKSLDKIINHLTKDYLEEEILSISIFGSSLFLKNPSDYDFLAMVKGDTFKVEHLPLSSEDKLIDLGISIKGIENYSLNLSNFNKKRLNKKQKNILDRTAVSLFRRHVPIFGYDFIENKNIFLKNIDAQISDLLYNSHTRYYLEIKNKKKPEERRSKKMLSRIYEASAYAKFKYPSQKLEDFRKNICEAINKKSSLHETKHLYDEFIKFLPSKFSE